MAGGLDYLKRTQKEQEARDKYIQGLKVPPGPPTQHGIYATPEWTGKEYPSIDWEAISQNQEPPAGWPRYPKFNEPGDVPGPPVQFGPPVTNANARAGFNFIPNGVEEKNIYYYHPDHLGSSSYITDKNGEVIQHTEYIAFGETFVDEHSVNPTQPYLFNGKELDYETGLYYYGARYYDPKVSLWLNTDPLSGYNPIQEVEHYIDGQHNGGVHNPMNLNTYTYTYQNPILYIDPNGKQTKWKEYWEKAKSIGNSVGEGVKNFVSNPIFLDAVTGGGYSRGLREIEYAKTNPSTLEWATFQMGENAVEIKSQSFGGYGGSRNPRRTINNNQKTTDNIDFIVTPDGVAVPKNQNRMKEGFENAGFPKRETTQTQEKGTIYTVPTKNGKIDIRVMEGSDHHPKRSVITHPNTNNPKTPSGKSTSDKRDNHIKQN